jgi:hypothetical protein
MDLKPRNLPDDSDVAKLAFKEVLDLTGELTD